MPLTVNINAFLEHIDWFRTCYGCGSINFDSNETCWFCGDINMYDVQQTDIDKLKKTFKGNNFNITTMKVA